jgi:hypothetical protein
MIGGSLQAQGDTLHGVVMHLPPLLPLLLALHQPALLGLDWLVRPEHYDSGGEARGATLAVSLGEHFTPALREARRFAHPPESCAG